MNKIKNEIFRVTGIMLLFSVLIVGGAQSQTNINSCTTINASGDYVLNQNILNSPNNACIVITASNVIFNGAGHTIDGSGSSPNGTKGIIVTGFNNVTVENTILTNWEFDILYYGVNAGNIIGNNVSLANYGIFLDSSANNLVKSNNASYNGVYGIWLGKGPNSTVINSSNLLVENTITRNAFGVYIDTVGNNTLNNNLVVNNGIGVYSTISPSNTIDSNNISNNNLSVELASSNFNTIKNNNMSSFFGITINSSNGNTIYNNYFNNGFNTATDDGNNSWNITRTLGTNIIGGPYIGGNFWSDYVGNDTSGDRLGDTLLPYNNAGNIINGGDLLPLTMSLGMVENVSSNTTVTSDPGGIGTSPSNPVVTYVSSPNPGLVTIQISPTTQPVPNGFSFLNQQVDITAPSANVSSPLTIVFTVNSTQIPSGQNESTIQIFKNGVVVPACSGSGATPDPCVSIRTTLVNGDIQITVLSSNGDPWNIGIPETPTPMPTTTPFPTGSISGMKFNDTNFNTLNDNEPGINGWKITLSNQSGIIATQTTNGNGNYSFMGLSPDNYTVAEVIQPGWLQVWPGSHIYTINLAGENITGKDFGNFLMGKISGTKFDDINGNGIKDPGEPGLPNWTINLVLGNVSNSTITDGNGDYNFSGLLVGTYIISESLQPGWIQTAPAISSTGSETHIVKILTSGVNATGKDFGNFKLGEIKGKKFDDINGNGIKDPEDLNISGWQINIVGTDTLTNTQVNQTLTTGPNGNYHIFNLTPGTYTITEVMQPGYIQTAPGISTSGTINYTVTIENSSTVISDKDFGNFKLGEVHGTKFEDLNVNGIKDQGEAGLQGWQININGIDTITNTLVNKTITTDINGDYNFTGLTNGTYTITEVAQNNWAQSAPATGKYTVNITSGAVITKQDFGNFHKGKITGGGWISIKGDPKATFGIDGQYPGGKTAQGNVEYQDHKTNLNIKSIQINTVTATLDNKKGTITGLAQVNGVGSYPFVVYVEDNGEPGKGIDVFNISLPTYTYSNGGILNGGNIQIHS